MIRLSYPKNIRPIGTTPARNLGLANQVDALNLEFLNRLEQALLDNEDTVNQIVILQQALESEIENNIETERMPGVLDALILEKQKLQEQQRLFIDYWLVNHSDAVIQFVVQEMQYPIAPAAVDYRLQRVSTLSTISEGHLSEELKNELQLHRQSLEQVEQIEVARVLEVEWQQVQQDWVASIEMLTESELVQLNESLSQELKKTGIHPLEHQIIEFKLQQVRQHSSQIQGVDTEKELQLSQAKLEEAKLKEQVSEIEEALQQEIIRLREIEILLRENEANRHRQAQNLHALQLQELQEIEVAIDTWANLPPLSSEKSKLWTDVVERIHLQKWKLQDLMTKSSELDVGVIDSVYSEYEVEQVLLDIETAKQDATVNIEHDRLLMYQTWISLNQSLQKLDALETNEQHIWSDLAFEWQHLDLVLLTHLSTVDEVSRDLNRWLKFIRSCVIWLFIWFVWRWAVGSIHLAWNSFVKWFKTQDALLVIPGVSEEAIEEVTSGSDSLFISLFHFVSAIILYEILKDSWMVSIALVWILSTGFLISKLIVERWVNDPIRQMSLISGLKQFVLVVVGLSLLNHIFADVFFAFQSVLWGQWLRKMLLVLLFVIQLGVWSDFLQERSNESIGFGRLKNWRDQWSNNTLGIRIRAMIAMVILICDLSVRGVFWMIEHSSLVGATLARNTLDDLQNHSGTPLDTSRWSLLSQKIEPFVSVVQQSIEQWKLEGRFGAVLVVADEGMGKSAILDLVLKAEQENSVHMFSVDNVIRNNTWSVTSLNQWILQSIGASDLEQDLITYLRSKPPTIFGIDDVHRLFLRDVSGFEVINYLFSIVQSTSDRHCWIMTCHLPTWSFLRSPSTPIQTDLFRSVIHLPPWSTSTLKEELTAMSLKHGVHLDFSSLSKISNEQALHRAEMAYWRLLFDASKGNPSIAKLLFTQSLFQSDQESVALVYLFPLMSSEILNDLSDDAYFVLASILLHDHLRFEELKQSLQMNVSQLQVICRNLIDRAIIHKTERGYEVYPMWLPFVEGMLLQKRFIGQWD